MMYFKMLIIPALILISEISFPQSGGKGFSTRGKFFDAAVKTEPITQEPGHVYSTISSNDSIRIIDNDLTHVIDVIVEFKDEPMFILQKMTGLKKVNMSKYQAVQQRFVSDLSALYESTNKAYSITFSPPLKKREYYKVFNGASLSIPKAMFSTIASLPYIKKIEMDEKVYADLKESEKIIGADSLWLKYNDKGDSVVVGIIDTGIDYLHPALGGGLGKGFKVIGGYDVVNKDNDPMDDMGHGTHVAGIVAGNCDSIKGIAPNALLMGFKVLNSSGMGYESDIIAGIERAVDPNDDDDYSDKVDIANMSLGGSGTPADAECTAVNNAVKLGVVFCIAAGNSGRLGFNTLGSPGSAELAITVGATDKTDKLAVFSSKGPTNRPYLIKPEVLAPGVDIYSSVPGGQYQRLSGTSMATPEVAGVCALLKHLHKDWTPEMIKSALMTSAKDLGYETMTQGAGRIDALKASEVTSFLKRPQLSFGIDRQEGSQWITRDTTVVTNKSAQKQNYSVSVNGTIAGIDLKPDVSSFSLQPGEEQRIIFTLSVENSMVPDLDSLYSYGGRVQIKGDKDEMYLPWAFVKAPLLILQFDKPVDQFYFISDKYLFSSYDVWMASDLKSAETLFPKGTYSAQFVFSQTKNDTVENSYVMKENVYLSGSKTISVSSGEALNTLSFKGVDENGSPINGHHNLTNGLFFQFKDIKHFYINLIPLNGNQKIRLSNFSERTNLIAGQNQFSPDEEKTIRVIQYPVIHGMKGDLELKNSPSDFIKQNVSITLPPDIETKAYFANALRFNWDGSLAIMNNYDKDNFIRDKKWSGALYLSRDIDVNASFTTRLFVNGPAGDPYWFTTEFFKVRHDSVFCYNFSEAMGTYYSPKNGTMNFGETPIHPEWMDNSSKPSLSAVHFNLRPSFYGPLRELRTSDDKYSTYNVYNSQNTIIKTGKLADFVPFDIPADKYKYELKNDHYNIAGRWGKSVFTTEINGVDGIRKAPQINVLRVLNSAGVPSGILKTNEKGKISLTAFMEQGNYIVDTSTTKIFLKKNGTTVWEPIKFINSKNDKIMGLIVTADPGKFTGLDSALIDMKVSVTSKKRYAWSDDAGVLKTEWVQEPAFAVGDYFFQEGSEKDSSVVIPMAYKLYNNYPNPFNPATTISYSLPEAAHVQLKIYDVLGREISTLVDQVQKAGNHKVKFNGSSLSSGVYIYAIHAGDFRDAKKLMVLK
ncbi:MAG: S8 family serine peptidase [Bacillota bacterium]